ncbi:MAG: hypothetical protein R3A46_05865 [Thermomicrobiales bacterium]
MHAIEAWDLLHALNCGNDTVLGGPFSLWSTLPEGIARVTGSEPPPVRPRRLWWWMREPLPAAQMKTGSSSGNPLDVDPATRYVSQGSYQDLRPPDRSRLRSFGPTFFAHHNPYIRHIVRRTRS